MTTPLQIAQGFPPKPHRNHAVKKLANVENHVCSDSFHRVPIITEPLRRLVKGGVKIKRIKNRPESGLSFRCCISAFSAFNASSKKSKTIYHRGTEDTEKNFLYGFFFAAGVSNNKSKMFFSVSSVPLW